MMILFRAVLGWPRLTLLFVLVVSGWMATGLGYSETRSILEGELPESDPLVAEANSFSDRYPDRNFYTVGVRVLSDPGIWTTATLEKVVLIAEAAAELPGALTNVQSLATWDHVTADSDGIDVRPLMPEAPQDAGSIADLRAIVENDALLDGRLVSEDGRMALIRLSYPKGISPDEVHAGLSDLKARFEGPEEIVLYGREFLNAEIDAAVSSHTQVLLPIAIVVLAGFLYLCFGRIQVVWLALTTIALTVVNFIGMMGVLEIPQSILSSTVPVILIVALGSYIVHLFQRAYAESTRHAWPDAVRESLERTGPAIALAAVSTAAGLATLSVFQIESVREFGILAAVGIGFAAFLCLTWLPAAMVVFATECPPERTAGRLPFIRLLAWLTEGAISIAGNPARARGVAVLIGLFALVGVSQIRVGSNPAEFFPRGHSLRQDFAALIDSFGADGFVFIELEAPPGKTIYEPDFLERVAAFQEGADQIPRVAYASSVVDRVFMRIHRVFNGDDPAFERVPDTRRIAAQYAEFYRWDAEETLAEMIEVSDAPRRLVIDVFADINDSAGVDEMVQALRTEIGQHFTSPSQGRATFGGEYVEWIAQNRYIVLGKLFNIALSITLVGILSWAVFRSIRVAAYSIIPAALAAVVVLGVMGWLGIRLDLASCVMTAIVVGIGVDFSVHFLYRFREISSAPQEEEDWAAVRETTIKLAAPPILIDTLSNVAAFAVCAASPLVPVRDFGVLICLSMLACSAATLALLPGFLRRWPR